MNSRKGMALLVVLGIILALVTAAASFILISVSERTIAKKQNDSTRAFYLAEAGLQYAIYKLDADAAGDYRNMDIGSSVAVSVPGDLSGTVDVDICKLSDDGSVYLFDITARGTAGNSNRKIQQTAKVERSWAFSDYMLYFGGNSDMETYTFDIGKDASIIGNIFANGDLSIGKDFYLEGKAYASGSITLDKDSVVTGGCYPDSELPAPPPILDPTPYDNEITAAGLAAGGDQSITGPISGTTYVNGTATITGDISVAAGGTDATIVAKGDILINPTIKVGDNIKLISGGTLSGEASYVVGNNCMLYATSLADFSKEGGTFGSSGAGSVIITPGDVSIAKGFGFYGFIFADGNVSIAKEGTITGVMAGNGSLSMAKDATLVHKKDVVDFTKIPGFSTRWSVTSLQDWEEVVPAD